jgi:hypothetical protein
VIPISMKGFQLMGMPNLSLGMEKSFKSGSDI